MQSDVVIVDTLEQREENVRTGLDNIREWYYKVGAELASLYREEAWLKRGFKNWEEYCLHVMGITNSYASRLMSAADIYHQLPDGLRPDNESGYRPLKAVRPELRIPAMQYAVEAAGTGKMTADLVRLGVKVAAKVAEEALASRGYVETEDGQQQSLQSAITKEMLEQMMVQTAHIVSKSKWTPIGSNEGRLDEMGRFSLALLVDLSEIADDEQILVRVYREKVDDGNDG